MNIPFVLSRSSAILRIIIDTSVLAGYRVDRWGCFFDPEINTLSAPTDDQSIFGKPIKAEIETAIGGFEERHG
jgi:hypothetical protein